MWTQNSANGYLLDFDNFDSAPIRRELGIPTGN